MNIIEKRATNPAAALDGTELVYVAQLGDDAVTTVLDMQTFITNGFLLISTAASTYTSIANSRYQFVSDAGTTYTVLASAVTANGNTIIELSNNSLTTFENTQSASREKHHFGLR